MTEPPRPDPDALLAEAKRSGRGRLKIFLGAAPGVGKTYAMLEEARAKMQAGIDVVIGLVETHGRADTAALLRGLTTLPRKRIAYGGQDLSELDLDAVLARRPKLVVIDEFAHTNAPGSRHPKRWQDVMEVLAAGIDVTTTLNIQHVESLNDVVARITGVRVQETVPDHVLARADDIELIDLPPEELIARLRAGKVYVPQQVARALDNFFTKGNLTALRELALRTTASRVDEEMVTWMRSNAIAGPWPTQDRLLVCVNEAPVAKALVRAGKRMADRARVPWIVATVVTPRHEAMAAGTAAVRLDALRLAESLGAEVVTLHAETDAAGELLAYARKRNVTRLVVGRPRSRSIMDLFRDAVFEKLLDAARDFEVTVVTQNAKAERRRLMSISPPPLEWRPYAFGLLATTAATLVALPISYWGGAVVGSLSVVYLAGVLAVGARYGLWPSLATSLLSFLVYNFFFTEPYFTLAVTNGSELAALVVFLLGSVFTGSLAGRLKAQVESMRTSQRRTEQLYAFARRIASATKADDVLWAAAAHLATTLECRSLILMPGKGGGLVQVQGHPSIEEQLEPRAETAARWAFEKNEPAGAGTGTLPTSDWHFVPLATASTPMGVVGVCFEDDRRLGDPETRRLLLAVEDQIAVAIERLTLSADLENTRVRAEGERLRTALLASVSHDLRTPLVTVIGGLTAMTDSAQSLPAASTHALAEEALHEARRLDRYVQNLLDMTKLGSGVLTLRREPVDVREIVGRVRNDLGRVLSSHTVTIDLPPTLPAVDADPVLLGQALANVLENAAKFSPAGSTVRIEAAAHSDNVAIIVTDEGPGIPASEQDRVFDLFYRVEQGDGRPSGTGLGLAIVKGLIEAHGGTVRALHRTDGSGTRIEMSIPVAEMVTPAEPIS